ncbi:hypothetical protein CGRA01v4_09769 [Colletotrichum graminicola]|nr:hypothetical protein CGRA01v4_09769 [Colletotrichum graminicola]
MLVIYPPLHCTLPAPVCCTRDAPRLGGLCARTLPQATVRSGVRSVWVGRTLAASECAKRLKSTETLRITGKEGDWMMMSNPRPALSGRKRERQTALKEESDWEGFSLGRRAYQRRSHDRAHRLVLPRWCVLGVRARRCRRVCVAGVSRAVSRIISCALGNGGPWTV